MTDPIPALFDRLPAGLFGPLGSPLAPLYWSVLARFYQLEFEREPFFLVKPAATDLVEEILRESPVLAERVREDADLADGAAETALPESEATPTRQIARRLLSRLERAGWFHYEYRSSHGLVLCFYPHAARILECLVRVARDEQPVFQGYAHAIASLLRPDAFAPRPGVALHQAKRQTLEMVRELKILERNMSFFIQRMLDEVTTPAGVLAEGLDRYRQAVMANYHRLKTVENLFKWRAEIVARLDGIERSAPLLESASRWYAEQFQLPSVEATRQVTADLALMRSQFESIPELADGIDLRNARFSGAALRKLMYLVRQDRRTEGQIQFLVDQLARGQAPALDFDVFRCELLADGFLYSVPSRRQRPSARPLTRSPREDPERVRRSVADSMRRPYSRKQVEHYVLSLLGRRARASLSEILLENDADYVRLIFVCAYGLDGESPYALEPDLSGDRQRRGAYEFPSGRLERAGKER